MAFGDDVYARIRAKLNSDDVADRLMSAFRGERVTEVWAPNKAGELVLRSRSVSVSPSDALHGARAQDHFLGGELGLSKLKDLPRQDQGGQYHVWLQQNFQTTPPTSIIAVEGVMADLALPEKKSDGEGNT